MYFARILVGLALATTGISLSAASAQNIPNGWRTVTDGGQSDSVRLEAMAPGWHLFPGPAAIFYQPENVVDGEFRVDFESHTFADAAGAHGVFFGASSLDESRFEFFEVLLDGEGHYRLGHQAGSDYHEITPWTAHEAIGIPTPSQPANNRVMVEVSSERLAVFVNGDEVTSFDPPEYFTLDGVIGIRALAGTSAHITLLEVEEIEP